MAIAQQRTLPHSLEAERSVLGAILIDNSVYQVVSAAITAADFFRDAHRTTYQCISGLIERGQPADLVTVVESLKRNDLLDDVGGPAWVSALVDGVPGLTNVAGYVQLIQEKSNQRRIIFEAGRLQASAYAEERPAAELARASIDSLAVLESGVDKSALRPVVVTLNTVRPEAIRWLWAGRLALGKLTMLSGDPGLGKSFITMDLTARASTGRSWPDGATGRDPIDVLILAAEDGLGDTVRPRLDALGADVSRVHVMTGTKQGRAERGPLLADIDAIETAIVETGARLLVIDPVSSYLGITDSHRDAEVRGLLTPLLTMAERHDCAVLGVMHLTKDGGKSALYRSSGSIAFVAQARIALMVTSDSENPNRRVLAASKCNVVKMPPALAYTLVDGRLVWEDAPLTDFDLNAHLAAASVSGPRDGGDRTTVERLISDLLADDSVWPLAAKDAERLAKEHSISYRTFQRSAAAHKIEWRRLGFGPGSTIAWYRPPRPRIDDTIGDNSLDARSVSSMSSMQEQAGNTPHTHIDDINGAFPRARNTGSSTLDDATVVTNAADF